MPKVSVIVPIYRVEGYIERCTRSLFEQTLDDIEYLFIDDCTPDRSIEILKSVLEEYPSRKKQVVVHTMEKNIGQAAVRKWGILNATGDYVIHCDSDDWVDRDMYRAMYHKAIEERADLVVCDFYYSDGYQHRVYKGCIHEDSHEFIHDCCFRKTSWVSWNKLVRKNLLQKDMVFPNDNYGEDMVLVLQALLKVSRVSYVSMPLYYFNYTNPDSITHIASKERILQAYSQLKNNTEIVLSVLKKKNKEEQYSSCVELLKWHVRTRLGYLIRYSKYRKLWKETYPEIGFLSIPHVKLKDKVVCLCMMMGIYPSIRTKLAIKKVLCLNSNK